MKRLLPLVNSDTTGPLRRDLLNTESDEEYLQKEMKAIKEENPVIASLIDKYAEKTKDSQIVYYSNILIYKLLRSQAEADLMKEQISLE